MQAATALLKLELDCCCCAEACLRSCRRAPRCAAAPPTAPAAAPFPASFPVIAATVAPAAAPRARPPTLGAAWAAGAPGVTPVCCCAQLRQADRSWLCFAVVCPFAG